MTEDKRMRSAGGDRLTVVSGRRRQWYEVESPEGYETWVQVEAVRGPVEGGGVEKEDLVRWRRAAGASRARGCEERVQGLCERR